MLSIIAVVVTKMMILAKYQKELTKQKEIGLVSIIITMYHKS